MPARKSTLRRPTVERLRQVLILDVSTGVLTWRVYRGGTAKPLTRAGYVRPDGYRHLEVDSYPCPAQDVVFAIHHGRWPTKILDHEDGDRDNNRPDNLIEAGYSDNGRNRTWKNERTGFRGVQRNCNGQRWQAMLKPAGKPRLYLGTFDTPEEAARAYDAAVLEHCGPRFPTNASLGLLK